MPSLIKKPRAIYWYIQSFLTKKKKFFFLGFILGLILTVYLVSDYALSVRDVVEKENSVGMVGHYTLVNLPLEIQEKISFGLTKITEDGQATPAASQKWQVQDAGRTYLFELKPNLKWQDGKRFISFDINYRLRDVEIRARGDSLVEFKLKEPYASLPWLVSQPLFKKSLLGLGEHKVSKLIWKDNFIESLELNNVNNPKDKITYKFYATEKDALLALKLKKVSRLTGLKNISSISNAYNSNNISSNDAFQDIVTLFFNTKKPPFDEKQIRLGLTYAIPDKVYKNYKKASGPIPFTSFYFNKNLKEYNFNDDLATKYLKDLTDKKEATDSKNLRIELLTVPGFKNLAEQISQAWSERGIKTTVKETSQIPDDSFDVFLAELEIPKNPDQYYLWHSTQLGNISNYHSPRIDKLLEDARRTVDENERLDLYQQFQKYLVEDDVAVFLFYGKNYSVNRQ
ncbi:hypothetical protein HY345_00435 [Candidatus Microgenomates bacterium]|nr:hypothetical protein [Candidatus Microgenomates bacterium]